MSVEAITIALGGAVVKGAVGIWLGSNKIAADMIGVAVDIAGQRLTGYRERRRFTRMVDESAEVVAERLEPLILGEYRGLPENERLAAVAAVTDTLDRVALTDDDLFAMDLDAGQLDRYVRRAVPDAKHRAGLSAEAGSLYDLVLRESCTYIIQFRTVLPQTGIAGMGELLRRDAQLLDLVREALDRLPKRRGEGDFERDYRQLVANRLDEIEFFGATLSEASRRYPLSVAYLSLTVSGDSESDEGLGETGLRVPDVLSRHRRIFVRGEAGLGKTTLLQWIAVHSARSTFESALSGWNDTVPFFIALRRHANGPLPGPEEFVAELGRHVSAEMPPGWVHAKLRSGQAVVLVDGLDELSATRREEVRHWLRGLVDLFHEARYVVTSRPSAAPADWLDGEDFEVCELEPMARADINEFVKRWHSAMREQSRDASTRQDLDGYEQSLLLKLESRNHLRRLAGYPLLCALLCALHRDRHAHLPSSRMELYEVSLHMLLERRDIERGLDAVRGLTRTAKTLLLQDVAYWLIRNGWSEAPTSRVVERIGTRLPNLPAIEATAEEVYRHLLERSGLIREPVHEHTNFVHRTFQEYLAGKAAVDADDVGLLPRNADEAEWRETIVMAAGHATPKQAGELVSALLDRGDREPHRREVFHLLAVSCLETVRELTPEMRQRVKAAATRLLPPNNVAAARSLATAGAFVLDLLAEFPGRTVKEVTAIIRTVGEIGDPAGIALLERHLADPRWTVRRALMDAWRFFGADEYAIRIVRPLAADRMPVMASNVQQVLAALRHVSKRCALQIPTPAVSEPTVLEALSVAANVESISVPDVSSAAAWSLLNSRAARVVFGLGYIRMRLRSYGVGPDRIIEEWSRDGMVGFRPSPVDSWLRELITSSNIPGPLHSIYLDSPELVSENSFRLINPPIMLMVGNLTETSDLSELRRWGAHLQVLWLHGRGASGHVLRHMTACRLLVLEGVDDLKEIGHMTALQELVLLNRGHREHWLPVRTPTLRRVHLDGASDGTWRQFDHDGMRVVQSDFEGIARFIDGYVASAARDHLSVQYVHSNELQVIDSADSISDSRN
ncbi:NACHT domain-containing protein [Micromonospora sp. NPDC049559]|uniref:NACHT domain-containing protein n=1 Tax=Micromonospora sp. NPDC049559 TaxID=3155923 RepID=UPI0034220178